MTHPNFFVSDQPGHSQPSNCISPLAPLAPCELVTDKVLRHYAALDPQIIAGGDELELAALAMLLPDICAELLTSRWADRADRAAGHRKGTA